MPTPTMPILAQATAEALGGTVNPNTGIIYPTYGSSHLSTPTLFSALMNLESQMLTHLAADSQGLVISLNSGLNVGVYPMTYRIGATDVAYVGAASTAMAASNTNYVWLESDGLLHSNTTGWPGTDHVRLAKVTTSSNAVTAIVDMRFSNFQAGIVNAWSAVAASSDVDMNTEALLNLGMVNLSDATTLTIASDAITPTLSLHRVDTQAAAATDDLVNVTLNASAGRRRFLLLACVTPARVVTVRSTGNIKLKRGDAVLDDVDKLLLLVQLDASHWVEVCRNFQSISQLLENLDVNAKSLTNVGVFNLKPVNVSVVSNSITRTAARHVVDGSTPVTLRTINGGAEGDLLILTGTGGSDGVTVESVTGNIALNNAASLILGFPGQFLVLMYDNGNWHDITSPLSIEALGNLGPMTPFPIVVHYPGALADNQATFVYRIKMPIHVRSANGRVVTAPSGGSCVVDVLKNGASIFSGSSNAVNITTGQTTDESALVHVDFAVNDEMTIKVLTASGAVSLTMGIEAYATATNPFA